MPEFFLAQDLATFSKTVKHKIFSACQKMLTESAKGSISLPARWHSPFGIGEDTGQMADKGPALDQPLIYCWGSCRERTKTGNSKEDNLPCQMSWTTRHVLRPHRLSLRIPEKTYPTPGRQRQRLQPHYPLRPQRPGIQAPRTIVRAIPSSARAAEHPCML